MSDLSQSINQLTQAFFSQIDFPDTEITVTKQEEGIYEINCLVPAEKSGVLIGYHGETISAIQLIISLIAHKQLGDWNRLVVNINDYRQKREQALIDMANNAAQRAKSTGEEVVMPPMESFDRRVVHLALSQDKSVHTESVGEGRDRRLIIYPTPASS